VAASCRVDGIVVGATFPEMIRTCKESHPDLPVFSPGVGVQGGSAGDAVSAGSDYLIVGRSILESDDPVRAAAELRAQSL
jgi:orotidine-5'-phosphate decarboxylase